VESSVLDVREQQVGLRLNRDPTVSPAAARIRLHERLRWHDKGCLLNLQGQPLALLSPAKAAGPLAPITTLDDWNRAWDQDGTGSKAGSPAYPGGNDSPPGRLHQALVPGDVRLSDRRAGADADQLGPGPAYWRWRKR
jgi:hypothetical protein